MMKKISRRSFLQVCGITAATAALTACGGGHASTKNGTGAGNSAVFTSSVTINLYHIVGRRSTILQEFHQICHINQK